MRDKIQRICCENNREITDRGLSVWVGNTEPISSFSIASFQVSSEGFGKIFSKLVAATSEWITVCIGTFMQTMQIVKVVNVKGHGSCLEYSD